MTKTMATMPSSVGMLSNKRRMMNWVKRYR
jgi:hypothetical protein